jgi:hypothetical protein
MNRRSFVGSATVATACALGRKTLLAKASSRLDEVRSRLGIEGPIVLRGFFYQGYCPISLHGTTIVHSPLGESVSVEGCGYKYSRAMAYDLLQAIVLDRFEGLSETRKRYGLTFARLAASGRFPLILGRHNARAFRERLAKWFDDVRLELPSRNAVGVFAYEPVVPRLRSSLGFRRQ